MRGRPWRGEFVGGGKEGRVGHKPQGWAGLHGEGPCMPSYRPHLMRFLVHNNNWWHMSHGLTGG